MLGRKPPESKGDFLALPAGDATDPRMILTERTSISLRCRRWGNGMEPVCTYELLHTGRLRYH